MSIMYALVFLGGLDGLMSLVGLSEKSLMSMSSSVTTYNCSRDPSCLSVYGRACPRQRYLLCHMTLPIISCP